jgi:hypothetical protein
MFNLNDLRKNACVSISCDLLLRRYFRSDLQTPTNDIISFLATSCEYFVYSMCC